jgi:ABC-type multidrug transport system ATPase subunit
VVPLLTTSNLRVDVEGVPAIDGLSMATTCDRVLVLGAARALFEAAAGMRPVSGGELCIEGRSPIDAMRARSAASAPLDPPLPRRWTVDQYVTWSARLAGHGRSDGARLATDALARMQLASSASTRLGIAGASLRRATVLAAAVATGAGVLLVEDPLAGLADDAARPLARVTARAFADRRTVIFASRLPLESPFALAADEALVIDGSQVAAQGPPAEVAADGRTLALRVVGDVDAFARAILEMGGNAIVTAGTPPPVHMRVELGPIAARDLVQVAEDLRAVVLELRPIARAFA